MLGINHPNVPKAIHADPQVIVMKYLVYTKPLQYSNKTQHEIEKSPPVKPAPAGGDRRFKPRQPTDEGLDKDLVSVLKSSAGENIAGEYQRLLEALGTHPISADHASLLVIDPQRSFTEGVWIRFVSILKRSEQSDII